MDDTTSRQQIDELADLYLTDPKTNSPVEGPAPIKLAPKVSDASAPVGASLDEQNAHALDADHVDDSHPMLRLTDDEIEEAQDQAGSKASGTKAGTKVSDTFSSADAQADLSHASSQQPESHEPAPRAVLEAVLMGNLPGMSGPWLTQYAQLLAQSEGPVVLLHVGEDAIDLELVEPRAEAQPAPSQPSATVRIPPMRSGRSGLVGLIDALVRNDAAPAPTILVRFDTFSDAQTLSRLAAMQDWTLLCGSDAASIAAASQQLRAAVHTDPRLADRSVGVMVMGSDDQAAQQATRRIASELDHDLVKPVELIGHLKRMQPVQVRDLGSFPDPVSLWPKLVSYFDSLEMPEPTDAGETVQAHAPDPLPAARATPKPTPADPTRAVAPKIEPKTTPPPVAPRLAPKPAAARAEPTGPASRPDPMPRFRRTGPKPSATPPRSEPNPASATPAAATQGDAKPTADAPRTAPDASPMGIARQAGPRSVATATPTRPTPTPRVIVPQPELDLVALIGQGPAALNDPAPLDARIPDQPDTQLVVDALGRVHLLKQGFGVVSDDVMALIEAGQWVTDHLELLALTRRDRDFVDAAPTLHLLTDRADLATQITGKLAGQIKLHLLQEVALGKVTGWFCTPLG